MQPNPYFKFYDLTAALLGNPSAIADKNILGSLLEGIQKRQLNIGSGDNSVLSRKLRTRTWSVQSYWVGSSIASNSGAVGTGNKAGNDNIFKDNGNRSSKSHI